MTANSTFKRLLNHSLFTVMLLTLVSETIAQERPASDLKDFVIAVEMPDEGLKMESSEGSAWIDLIFSKKSVFHNLQPYLYVKYLHCFYKHQYSL